MWRAGSWHCAGCGYDNFRENVRCRQCRAQREGERREMRNSGDFDRSRGLDINCERLTLTRRRSSRSCDKNGGGHNSGRFGRKKPRMVNGLRDKVIDDKTVSSSGAARKRELESSSAKMSSKNLTIISPAGCIKRLENLPGGKTPLLVKTFPDIVEYFGKFGTISDVREEKSGISKITFFEKSSAVKALSCHKQYITFYEYTSQEAGQHDNEDRLGEAENSRVKGLENYEADVNSFLFGTENIDDIPTAAHSGTKKMNNTDSKIVKDHSRSGMEVSASLYSRQSVAKKPKFHIPHAKFFGVEADLSFVKEAENNKWKIAVERFESRKDEEHVEFNKKKDDAERKQDVGVAAFKLKPTVKAARVPSVLERRLLAMAGGYEDPGSVTGKLVLRSRNSDEDNAEVVDIADSDEEVIEVNESEIVYQSKLSRLENASEKEKKVILMSTGIVSRNTEPLVVEERELIGGSAGKDTESPAVKPRELLEIREGDSLSIGTALPVLEVTEIVDLNGSKDTDPPVVETREFVDSNNTKDTNPCDSDSDTGLYSDGSEGI